LFYFALKTKEKFDAVDLYFSAERRKNEEEEEENKNKQICAQCFGYLLRVDLDLQLFPNSLFKKKIAMQEVQLSKQRCSLHD